MLARLGAAQCNTYVCMYVCMWHASNIEQLLHNCAETCAPNRVTATMQMLLELLLPEQMTSMHRIDGVSVHFEL